MTTRNKINDYQMQKKFVVTTALLWKIQHTLQC